MFYFRFIIFIKKKFCHKKRKEFNIRKELEFIIIYQSKFTIIRIKKRMSKYNNNSSNNNNNIRCANIKIYNRNKNM